MEKASTISLKVIKSIVPLILKANADLKKKNIPVSEEEILREIKEAGVKDTEIYHFMDEIINRLLRVKVAYHIDWTVMAVAVKDLLVIFEQITGYRSKYDIIVKEMAEKVKLELRGKEIDKRRKKVDELAEILKKTIQEEHKKTKEKVSERKQKNKATPK